MEGAARSGPLGPESQRVRTLVRRQAQRRPQAVLHRCLSPPSCISLSVTAAMHAPTALHTPNVRSRPTPERRGLDKVKYGSSHIWA